MNKFVGECKSCHKHIHECLCDINAHDYQEALIRHSAQLQEIGMSFEVIRKANLWLEFEIFASKYSQQPIRETIEHFCSQYPDKFYVVPENERYPHMVIKVNKEK